MELWAIFAICAAFMQNIRSMTQKRLTCHLDTLSATYARFLFASPIAGLLLLIILSQTEFKLPRINFYFLFFGVLGGFCQILATVLLVYLYSLRNFAVGAAFKKTEAIQASILGFIIIGDLLSVTGILGLVLGILGVLALTKSTLSFDFRSQSLYLGLLCGSIFAGSAVFYRACILSISGQEFFTKAIFALTFVLVFQSLSMGIFLEIRKPGTLNKIVRYWPSVLVASIAGALASSFWFAAFALQNVAYVKAVGQIELLFSVLASIIFFKEKISIWESSGIILIASSVLILVL